MSYSPEQRTLSAFAVIGDEPLDILTVAAELLSETVDAEELICVSMDKLAVYRDIIRKQLCAAFLAGLVICHYSFTTFARNIRQSWESICAAYLSENVPITEWV